MTLPRQNNFLAGSNLTLTCEINIDHNVDTPFTINVTWTMTSYLGSGGDSQPVELQNRDHVNISSLMTRPGFHEYRSQVIFSNLSGSEDSGVYTCIVNVEYLSGSEFIMSSDTNDVNVTLIVTGMIIVYISIMG